MRFSLWVGLTQPWADVLEWRDVGVDEVIVPDFALGGGQRRSDAMDAIIEQVAPEFR